MNTLGLSLEMPGNLVRRTSLASDGIALHAVEGGNPSGPPLVFIHGYLFSGEVFLRQFNGALADRFRLITFDLRGHGKSERPDMLDCYVDPLCWASDVNCVLDAFGIDRAVLIGWSLGGRIALNYAWHHGCDRVAGLNLVASIADTASHGSNAGLPPALVGLLDADPVRRQAATRSFVEACAGSDGIAPELVDAFSTTANKVPVNARRGARGWPLLYEQSLSWVTCPLLFSLGLGDQLASQLVIRDQARVAGNADVLAMDGGHLAFLQNPGAFDASLAAFAEQSFNL